METPAAVSLLPLLIDTCCDLDAFPALVEFAKSCVKNGVACRFSVVDCIGEDAVASCKRLAESAGVPLYVRKYIADS